MKNLILTSPMCIPILKSYSCCCCFFSYPYHYNYYSFSPPPPGQLANPPPIPSLFPQTFYQACSADINHKFVFVFNPCLDFFFFLIQKPYKKKVFYFSRMKWWRRSKPEAIYIIQCFYYATIDHNTKKCLLRLWRI